MLELGHDGIHFVTSSTTSTRNENRWSNCNLVGTLDERVKFYWMNHFPRKSTGVDPLTLAGQGRVEPLSGRRYRFLPFALEYGGVFLKFSQKERAKNELSNQSINQLVGVM